MIRLAFQCSSNACTDVGCRRELNEDAFVDRPERGLWAVADGMGGHSAGDLASGMLAESLSRIEPAPHLGSYVEQIKGCVATVNARLHAEAERRNEATIGATLAVLAAQQRHCVYLWAGDSRIYLYRDHVLHQLTRDHSVLQELLDAGQVAGDLEEHPNANQITRAVGGELELELDAEMIEIRQGDVYLLCSDGLNKEIDDAAIAELLALGPERRAERLVAASLEREARDNVTVVAVDFA